MSQPLAALFGGLRATNRDSLLRDGVAGLTTAAVVIPKTMAFAVIAGLPTEAGLYTAVAPMLIYAVLGSSRVLSVSSTSTIALLTASALVPIAQQQPALLLTAAAMLALLVGAMLAAASLLRLGFVANFISDPVLTGFKAGIGVLIIVDQLPKLLGVHITKDGFFRDLAELIQNVPAAHTTTLLLSIVTLGLLWAGERFVARIPWPLIAVIVGISVCGIFDLQALGVATVGAVRPGLPSIVLPDLTLVRELWPAAAGIALMSFTESIATARAFANSSDPRPNADRELMTLGLANMASAFTGALPAGGGASQTAVNRRAGASTQVAALVTVAVTIAVLLTLSSIIALLPLATLAAVIVVTSLPLLSPSEFRAIWSVRRTECYWALTAVVGVILLGSLNGILVAIAISILTLLYHANRPPVYELARKPHSTVYRPRSVEHPLDETFDGLLILRTEGRMHFANAQRVGERMWEVVRQQPRTPDVILIDLSGVPDIEVTALRMLTEAEAKLRASGTLLWLAALNPAALSLVRRAPLGSVLGRDRLFTNLDVALAEWQRMHPHSATTHASRRQYISGSNERES